MSSVLVKILIFSRIFSTADSTRILISNKNISNQFNGLLTHVSSKIYKPFSVQVLQEKEEASLKDTFDWKLISEYPIVSATFHKDNRSLHHTLNSILVIVWFPHDNPNVETLTDRVKNSCNKKKDYFIFVGSDSGLAFLLQNKLVQGLRQKIGLSINSGDLHVDPVTYDGGATRKIKDFRDLAVTKVASMGANLRGRHLRISGVRIPPYLVIQEENGKEELGGNHYKIFTTAAEKFNFTFYLHAPPEITTYGIKLPNGTWIGMIADIIYVQRNFDIAIFLGYTSNVYDIVDFTSVVGDVKLLFVTALPKVSIKWQAIFYPFQQSVWIFVMISFACIAIAMISTMVLQPQYTSNFRQVSVYNVVLDTLFVPVQLSLDQAATIPGRIKLLSFLWMVLVLNTGTGYRCNLVSFLTFPSYDEVPTNFEDLSKRDDYSFALNRVGAVEESFFTESKSAIIKSISRRLRIIRNNNTECLTNALLRKNTVCIGWVPHIKNIAAEILTLNPLVEPLFLSKTPALWASMSIAFQKDSIYVDSFNPIISALFESFIYNKWEDETVYEMKKQGKIQMMKNTHGEVYKELSAIVEAKKDQNDVKPLAIENVQIIFIILGIGCCLSLFIFFCELFYSITIIRFTTTLIQEL